MTPAQQKYGSLTLLHDQNLELDLFDWCGIAVESTDGYTSEISSWKTKCQGQEKSIQKLMAQLEDFTKTKADDDAAMLEKFRLLLNEKKLKIRNLSRVLAAKKIDPKKVTELEESLSKRKAGASRSGKRKESVGESDDDAFEKPKAEEEEEEDENGSDVDDQGTPDPSDDETVDEDAEEVASAPAKNTRQASSRSQKPKVPAKESVEAEEIVTTPPKRELPFGKKPAASKKAASPVAKSTRGDGDETESDDEL